MIVNTYEYKDVDHRKKFEYKNIYRSRFYMKYKLHKNKIYFQDKWVLPTILIVSFFTIYFINTLGLYNVRIGQMALFIIGVFSFIYTLIKNNIGINFKIVSIFWIITILGLISFLINGNADLPEYLWPITYGGISLVLLNFDINSKPITIMYYIVCIYYLFAMITNQSPESITGNVSRNNISVTILTFFTLMCIVRYKQNIKISSVLAFVALPITFWGVGRSGIITFLIISTGFMLFSFKGRLIKKNNIIKFLVIIAMILILLFFFLESFIVPAIENFNKWGFESVRTTIWKDYISNIISSPLYILCGYPLSKSSLLTLFNYNLHNSFLNLHSRYGLIVFAYFLIKIIQQMLYSIINRKILFFFLLLAITFRINFDLAAFNGILDVFIYYLIFERKFNKTSRRFNYNE